MLDNVSQEFYDRFAEFDSIKEQIELFSNPIEIQIEAQPSEFQLELCDLQSDPFLQSKKNERNEAFWKLVSNEHFPVLITIRLSPSDRFITCGWELINQTSEEVN